jgi:molybdopterin molybdotransferase
MPMISVEDALEKILDYVSVLNAETKPILESLGQVLAEDVYSDFNIPPFSRSAMDGYAVIAGDTRMGPVDLKVVDSVVAGSISNLRVVTGQAVRIMTGAPIPEGTDAVVKLEDTAVIDNPCDTGKIRFLVSVEPGTNVRPAGEDIAQNSLIMKKGTILRPQEIGVLASLGRSRVLVTRRPDVAILATGNEILQPGQPLEPGKIYDSNSYAVAASVLRYGGIPRLLGIALDREDLLVEKIHQGLDADMLITTGGVSVGDYDLVKTVVKKMGQISSHSVKLRPGKPLTFGFIPGKNKDVPYLGLPGNPVSSLVSFELFARPAILKMMGMSNLDRATIEVVMEEAINNDEERRVYMRAIVEKRGERYFAHTTGPQGSGILTSMIRANALVIVPETEIMIQPGDVVQAIMLD